MNHLALTIAACAATVLILAAIAYFRGNVPGFLAAIYCLLLTLGCVVIFYRAALHSPAAFVAVQASVSRPLVVDRAGRQCATLIPAQDRPAVVRDVVCPAGARVDCIATLDVPADQLRAWLTAAQPLGISAFVTCP